MRLPSPLVAALALLLPAAARAQTIAMKDLAGTWVGYHQSPNGKLVGWCVKGQKVGFVKVIRPDSTWAASTTAEYTGKEQFTRFFLRGDTLRYDKAEGAFELLALKDQQLLITEVVQGAIGRNSIYKRASDASKPEAWAKDNSCS